MKRALLLVLVACGPDLAPAPTDPPPVKQEEPPVKQEQPLTGLPCDVQAALQANCAGCHVGAVYIPGFATRDDLVQLGAKVSDRMSSTTQPMPPSRAFRQPTAEERATISSWVTAGMPAGACGGLQ